MQGITCSQLLPLGLPPLCSEAQTYEAISIVPKTLCVFIFSFPTNLNQYCNKDKLVQKQLVHVGYLLHLYLRKTHCPFSNQCTCSMSLEFVKYLEINVMHFFLISKMLNMPLIYWDIKFCLILWNCTKQQGYLRNIKSLSYVHTIEDHITCSFMMQSL